MSSSSSSSSPPRMTYSIVQQLTGLSSRILGVRRRRHNYGIWLSVLIVVLFGCTLLSSIVTIWKFHQQPPQWDEQLQQYPGVVDYKHNLVSGSSTRSDNNNNKGQQRLLHPTHHACDNYEGILHIESGDQGAAAGTLFFQYMVNQLIYADMYNLKPFIHLNNVSKHVYDPIVHGGGGTSSTTTSSISDSDNTPTTPATTLELDSNSSISFIMLHGMTVEWTSDGYRRFAFGSYPGRPVPILQYNNKNETVFSTPPKTEGSYPGRPIHLLLGGHNNNNNKNQNQTTSMLTPRTYQIYGTGVWNHYFLPVSDFVPGDVSCENKPLIKMHYYHLNPSLLFYTPWSVKSWPYTYVPERLRPQTTLLDWYQPMRQKGYDIVQKYITFQPHMIQLANQANPPIHPPVPPTMIEDSIKNNSSYNKVVAMEEEHNNYQQCLAMHVRHSDKGGSNRKRIPLEAFLPYAEAYQKAGGQRIFVATDSGQVLTTIHETWPEKIRSLVRSQGDDDVSTVKLTTTTRAKKMNHIKNATVLRSDSKKAVFNLYSHHITNTEVLVDILAMSKCSFFIHGFSAVSEATIYLNFPQLHDNGIDLENHPLNNQERKTPEEFQKLVQTVLLSSGIAN